MKRAMISALMLVLMASIICVSSGMGSVVVDIVGSKTNNTHIIAACDRLSELEIIGSNANNTTIYPPPINIVGCCFDCPPNCPNTCDNYPPDKIPCNPYHLGVDAWYGQYWYTKIFTPKWPMN